MQTRSIFPSCRADYQLSDFDIVQSVGEGSFSEVIQVSFSDSKKIELTSLEEIVCHYSLRGRQSAATRSTIYMRVSLGLLVRLTANSLFVPQASLRTSGQPFALKIVDKRLSVRHKKASAP